MRQLIEGWLRVFCTQDPEVFVLKLEIDSFVGAFGVSINESASSVLQY